MITELDVDAILRSTAAMPGMREAVYQRHLETEREEWIKFIADSLTYETLRPAMESTKGLTMANDIDREALEAAKEIRGWSDAIASPTDGALVEVEAQMRREARIITAAYAPKIAAYEKLADGVAKFLDEMRTNGYASHAELLASPLREIRPNQKDSWLENPKELDRG